MRLHHFIIHILIEKNTPSWYVCYTTSSSHALLTKGTKFYRAASNKVKYISEIAFQNDELAESSHCDIRAVRSHLEFYSHSSKSTVKAGVYKTWININWQCCKVIKFKHKILVKNWTNYINATSCGFDSYFRKWNI